MEICVFSMYFGVFKTLEYDKETFKNLSEV